MGWFYGLKLHVVINDKGEIINFAITPEMVMIEIYRLLQGTQVYGENSLVIEVIYPIKQAFISAFRNNHTY
jgi:hypothetical protein